MAHGTAADETAKQLVTTLFTVVFRIEKKWKMKINGDRRIQDLHLFDKKKPEKSTFLRFTSLVKKQ